MGLQTLVGLEYLTSLRHMFWVEYVGGGETRASPEGVAAHLAVLLLPYVKV